MPRRNHLLIIGIMILALILRLPGLGKFMTADEANWMLRSASFYDEILAGNFGGTFLTTHPGTTVMWLIGGGETIQEARLKTQVDSENLFHFRKSAVFPVAVASSLLIGLVSWLLLLTMGPATALAVGIILAGDPYLTGSSQISHLDALLSLFMIASWLSFLTYLHRRTLHYLILAGVLFGLALGTKFILALWVLPMCILLLIVHAGWRALREDWYSAVRRLMLLIGVAAVTMYALWPAAWVKDDITHSFTRDIAVVITDEHVALADSDQPITPATFYIRTLLGRTTPLVMALIIVAGGLAIRALRRRDFQNNTIWLLVYSIGFTFLITLAAKKGDRYFLPAHTALLIMAGFGFSWLIVTLSRYRRSLGLISSGGVGLIVLITLFLWSPYTIAYNNPLFPTIRPLSQQGWGEGLDAAARWLNAHPLGERLTVASWYPGVLGSYFQGKTFSLSSRDDYRVGYVVTYRNMGGRSPDTLASDVLDEFRSQVPLHTIAINDVPYVWIYETLHVGNFTKHIGELVREIEVGQTVTPPAGAWDSIDIGFATFSSRENTEDVILEIHPDSSSSEVLRTVRINARNIIDNEWTRFSFEPLKVTANTTFYVTLRSPTSEPGNAVTVRYIDVDILPGQMTLRRAPLKAGQTANDFFKPGDIAYRLTR